MGNDVNGDSVGENGSTQFCSNNKDSDIDLLHRMRTKHIGKVIVANLNVASLPNRIDELRDIVKDFPLISNFAVSY